MVPGAYLGYEIMSLLAFHFMSNCCIANSNISTHVTHDNCTYHNIYSQLLAERSLALQEAGKPATSGGEKMAKSNAEAGSVADGKGRDPREEGKVNYWRWKGQHLVRYLTWPSGKDYGEQDKESRAPAILLVHGE